MLGEFEKISVVIVPFLIPETLILFDMIAVIWLIDPLMFTVERFRGIPFDHMSN